MTAQPVPATVVRAADGEEIDVAGVRHLFKLTGGRLGLERFELAPGTVGARPHVHSAHDEYFYVLTGRLMVDTTGGAVELGPGDLAAAPRGAVHGYRNESADVPVTALCLYTPPGYEQYFRDVHAAVAAGAEPTPELLAELRSRYATESR
ncbi:cupin domain-containing protein [Modestobacter sp. NPDC049651]|uniref:cupin domain-containing protein n=1 Tax=unclassified Modestobacter TaxID=2643866 RepID=UPI0033D4285C